MGSAKSAVAGVCPKPESTGSCLAKPDAKASRVMIFNRAGYSLSRQPLFSECCSTLYAKFQVAKAWGWLGLARFAANNALMTRSRISAAAFFVKVSAKTSSGSFTVASKAKIR